VEMPSDEEPVQIHEADCLDVMREMRDGAVGAVITDPPYSERTHKGHDTVARRTAGDPGYDGAERKVLGYAAWTEADVRAYVPEMCRVSRGWVVIMTDHTLAPLIARQLESCGRYVFAPLPFYAPGSRCRLSGDGPSSWTDWIIVARTAKQRAWGTLPGGYVAGEGWREREHMGGKPTMLMRALVRDYSKPGDTVLDPFAGMGTTGKAALAEGRRAILVERDPLTAEAMRERIREAMGMGRGSLLAALQPSLFPEDSP